MSTLLIIFYRFARSTCLANSNIDMQFNTKKMQCQFFLYTDIYGFNSQSHNIFGNTTKWTHGWLPQQYSFLLSFNRTNNNNNNKAFSIIIIIIIRHLKGWPLIGLFLWWEGRRLHRLYTKSWTIAPLQNFLKTL